MASESKGTPSSKFSGMPNNHGIGYVDYVLWGTTANRLDWLRQNGPGEIPVRASNRRSSTPTAWNNNWPSSGHLLLQRLRPLDLG